MTQQIVEGDRYSVVYVRATEANPLPVSIGSATLSVTADGVEIKNDAGNPIPVNDAGGSLTVDSPQLTSIDEKLPALVGGRVPVDIAAISIGDVEIKNDTGNPIPVADAGSSLTVDGKAYRTTVSFTRPANTTAYTAGDVVGSVSSAIHTLSAAGPSGGFILLQSMALFIGSTAVPAGMGAFRIHLYNTSPTAVADNAVFNLSSAERAAYMGFVDLGTPQDLGDTIYTQTDYIGRLVKLATASTSLFAEIETRGAYTPESGTVYELRMSTLESGL